MKIRFNIENLLSVYNASGELKKDFGKAIFGGSSRMGPEYFNGAGHINFRHLENLCNRYGKDPFFFISFEDTNNEVSNDSYSNVSGVVSHSNVEGDLTINNGKMDYETLQRTIKNLEQIITQKDDIIADKCEQIKWMKAQWDSVLQVLKSQSNQ